jgi:hypothetical protein
MQPLGLNRHELAAYHQALQSPHDFHFDIDVLDMEEKHVGSIKAIRSHRDGMGFLDGQVNLQREGIVKRTATFTFYDPDSALHLDNESPFAGAVFADRMIRARHTIYVPGVGDVTSTPFVGPVVKPGRQGDLLTVECQDKTLLAMEGVPHKTVKKGRLAVEAIEEIMRDCTGESRFRLPKNSRARLSRSYSVGWKAEASPWRICQKIAARMNMQLVYACDGALMLRQKPRKPLLVLDEDTGLTDYPRADYDVTGIRNIVRVTGEQNKKKHINIAAVARPKAKHPHSPQSLGRNNVSRYLPELIDDSSIRKTSKAKQRAADVLEDRLPMGVSASFPGVPFFHLDYADPIRIMSDWGAVTVPFIDGSIPLGVSGDAEYGAQKRVSKPRRRS